MSVKEFERKMLTEGFNSLAACEPSVTFLFNYLNKQTPIAGIPAKRAGDFTHGILCLTDDYLVFLKTLTFNRNRAHIYTKVRDFSGPTPLGVHGHLPFKIEEIKGDNAGINFHYDSEQESYKNTVGLYANYHNFLAFQRFLTSGETPRMVKEQERLNVSRRPSL